MPKRDLVTTDALVLEQRRLTVPASLPHAATLRAEVGNFRVKVNIAGHDAYGAGVEWRDGAHDALVLAVALAVWYGENQTSGYVEFSPNSRQPYTPTGAGYWMSDDDDEDSDATPDGFRSW